MKLEIYRDSFDSDILKRECFKININITGKASVNKNLENAIAELACADLICLVTDHNPDLNNLIVQSGFSIIGTKNVYKLENFTHVVKKENENLKIFSKNWAAEFLQINDFKRLISTLVVKSRYWKDSLIPKELSFAIYEKWFYNSIYNKYADEVFIAINGKKPIGILTLKKHKEIAHIDLIVVDPDEKGKGIGNLLLVESFNYCQQNGINSLYVETEGENIEANRFYQRSGFLLTKHSLVFHKHRKKEKN